MIPDTTLLALTCLILLGAGYGVMILVTAIPPFRRHAAEAWPILFTETLYVGLVAGGVWLGGWVLAFLLTAMALRVMFEASYVALMPRGARIRESLAVTAAFGAVCLAAARLPMGLLCLVVVAGIAAGVLILRFRLVPRGSRAAALIEAGVFPGLPLLLMTSAGWQGGYGAWLLVAFLLVETFDSYALLGGRIFGRHKAFPQLSPRKTVEGLGFGAAALLLTAAIAGAVLADLPIVVSGAVALIAGGLAVAGDLAASRLKRRGAVKDYPRVLRHQGGLFDMTDAWIAAGAGLVAVAALAGLA